MSVMCPHCQDDGALVKNGKSAEGKQRFCCRSEVCQGRTFILNLNLSYPGRLPATTQQILDMSLNGSGIRDISRVLHVSSRTVISELKKAEQLQAVNEAVLRQVEPEQVRGEVVPVQLAADCETNERELDEMWSFVQKKANQRWLWQAIDHATGVVLAYVLGGHNDDVSLKLKQLLEPFGINRFYTDGWGAYERHLDSEQHQVGKANRQKIEREPLALRTRIKRLARRTICFSKSEVMHDVVIGLYINRHEFGVLV